MRTETITKTYKTFSELTDKQKEWAISQHFDWNVGLDHEWWEFTYDSFKELCKLLGIEVDLSKTYFSGFSHQGQGSSFAGDVELWDLVDAVRREAWKEEFPTLDLSFPALPTVKHEAWLRDVSTPSVSCCSGRGYNGECSLSTDAHTDYEPDRIAAQIEKLTEWGESVLQELNDHLFTSLEKEFEYLTSDEAIAESLEANEMEFDVDALPED